MSRLILGTAGHIDHGKTALVRALTGVDTDRLPEEKLRGITIDLGFANLQLGGLTFGVVDVPGHESFIRNMLAGASGMDAVLLVVAADEGVMPQTREHLAILDLLGVRSAVVAITKSDLATPEWTQLVIEDVRETLRPTALRAAPIVAVSSKTGSGLDELRAAIAGQGLQSTVRRRDDLFRMPIDRVFTVHGTGTVVTGTVWGGAVGVDETVEVRPAGVRARVRGIQVHGQSCASAGSGERAALALSGVEKSALERGDVALGPGWSETRMLTVLARVIVGTAWSIAMRQRLRVHVGTTEVLARAVLLDAPRLVSGERGWLQLRLEQPLIARAGDRVVLRSYSPVTTIGGGVVAELAERKRTRLSAGDAALLERIVSGPATEAVSAVLAQRGDAGATAAELAIHTPHPPSDISTALATLGEDAVRIADRVFAGDVVKSMIGRILATVDSLHARHPLRPMIERAELRAAAGTRAPALVDYAIEQATARGQLLSHGSGLARAGFRPTLSARQLILKSAMLERLGEAGLAAPTIAELAGQLGETDQVRQLARLLEGDGLVREVAPELFVEAESLRQAEDRTRRELGGRRGLSATEFRTTLPVSRKHLIPLLEYFDRIGVTTREGDLRRVDPASDRE